jgi:predicted DNA binding CopG/RHH family protein
MSRIPEDDVFNYYQDGLPDDFKLDKTKIVRRKKVDLAASTVQISVKFEYDLLQQLKSEAENKGLPYQTFMKQIIKNYFDDKPVSGELTEIKNRLSNLEAAIARAGKKQVKKQA